MMGGGGGGRGEGGGMGHVKRQITGKWGGQTVYCRGFERMGQNQTCQMLLVLFLSHSCHVLL